MKNFVLSGRVEHGKARGKKLGAPTLNFDSKPLGLEYGVYLGFTTFSGSEQRHSSIAHWGPRPTFKDDEPILEVHLLNFSEELYGQEVSFEFLKKIREIQSFESPEALKVQIQKDLAKARAFFA